MAAAIAYYWVLSLIPLLLLGAAAMGYAAGGAGVDQLATMIRRFIPQATAAQVVTVLRTLVLNRKATGGLGLLSLVWIASAAFDAISTSLTEMQGGKETRPYIFRRLLAIVLMLASGLFLLAGVLIASFSTAVEAVGNRALLELLPPGYALPPGSVLALLPAAFMLANFFLLYWGAPCTPMSGLSALLGAAAGAALWDQGRRLFDWYLLTYARYDALFGALGAFIAVLLWIYYTGLILLLGGALAHLAVSARGR
jgi:membrane protein